MKFENVHVRLIPLREVSIDGLWEAAQSLERWTLSLAPYGQSREQIRGYVAQASAQEDEGWTQPFAVLDQASGRVLGSTRLTLIDRENAKAELGYTWYARDVWGTAVNPSCKRLLLRHAFETMGLERVYFYVNLLNERSLAAVERLGAVREGVLRHDRRLSNGAWRDTVVLSILSAEWPAVRASLEERLLRFD